MVQDLQQALDIALRALFDDRNAVVLVRIVRRPSVEPGVPFVARGATPASMGR